ncbi:MAG: hypothetical protein ACP5LS_02215 [Thermoprotei archaeon]
MVSLFLIGLWIRIARIAKITGKDVHKSGHPEVPEMGGIIILPSLIVGLVALYLIDSHYVFQFGFIVLAAGLGWALGLVDDLKELSALPKLSLSVIVGLPIFFFVNPFSHPLMVPFLRPVRLPLVYPLLALALIAGTANSFNSYDVVNGSTTFSATLISVSMAAILFLKGELGLATVVAMVAAVSLALFMFNAYPARIFIGDTGSFALGAAIASAAIASYNESFLFIAMLPMIINAAAKFMSVGRIYEHHRTDVRITRVTDDGKIASYEGNGGISLVRLLVAQKPLSEKQVFLGLATLEVLSTAFALVLLPFVGVTLRW